MTSNFNQFGSNDFEIVRRDVAYQGVFRLVRFDIKHRLFNGGWSEVFKREVLERYSAAAVLPYDPTLDRVILIEQFRAGGMNDAKGPWMIEIPAGILTGNDTPEKNAYSEAHEEAGCTLLDLLPIHECYPSVGAATEYLSIFCGKVDAADVGGVHGLKHEHEDILVHNLPFADAIRRLEAGDIRTVPAIISLLWLQVHRERLRKQWQ